VGYGPITLPLRHSDSSVKTHLRKLPSRLLRPRFFRHNTCHWRSLSCSRQPWVLHAHQRVLHAHQLLPGSSPNHTVLGEVCFDTICNIPDDFKHCRLTHKLTRVFSACFVLTRTLTGKLPSRSPIQRLLQVKHA
jgi:hypothetical protein